SLFLRRSGHRQEAGSVVGAAVAFVIREEEEFVPPNGSAERASKLAPHHRRLRVGGGLEEADCVQLRVAQELPGGAVELVRATANAGIDDGSGGTPELGAVVISIEPEFLDRVGRRLNDLIGEGLVTRAIGIVIQTIQA